MAWVQRGRKRYFYRTVRHGRRTTLVYLGSGAAAEEAAADIERRRAERQAQAAALRADAQRHADATAPLDELCTLSDLVMRATLIGRGFHQHSQGQWRRRKHGHRDEPTEGEGLLGGSERTAGAGQQR
jgi:hypothetical protein